MTSLPQLHQSQSKVHVIMENPNKEYGRRYWLNITLVLLFLFVIFSLVGREASGVSQQSVDIWTIIHAASGVSMMIGATIHMRLQRTGNGQMRSSDPERFDQNDKKPTKKRTNTILIMALGLLCTLSGIGMLIGPQDISGISGIHRLSGMGLIVVLSLHVYQRRKWFARCLLSKSDERTTAST